MDHTTVREMRAVREAMARGRRRTYHALYQTLADGVFCVTIAELPGVTIRSTGRKGVPLAARARIALELDVPEDSFDVATKLVRRRARTPRARSTAEAPCGRSARSAP